MARDTAKMGLHSWNNPPDPYNYQQLDQNWQIIDFHDHTPGRGVQIPMGGIAPGAVGTVQLAPTVGVIHTGGIIMWPTPSAPAGWLSCDGGQYQIALYTDLYGVIGLAYTVSAPTGYFNVPNLSVGPPSYPIFFVIKT